MNAKGGSAERTSVPDQADWQHPVISIPAISHYAAENPVEFFAASGEVFYETVSEDDLIYSLSSRICRISSSLSLIGLVFILLPRQ